MIKPPLRQRIPDREHTVRPEQDALEQCGEIDEVCWDDSEIVRLGYEREEEQGYDLVADPIDGGLGLERSYDWGFWIGIAGGGRGGSRDGVIR